MLTFVGFLVSTIAACDDGYDDQGPKDSSNNDNDGQELLKVPLRHHQRQVDVDCTWFRFSDAITDMTREVIKI